MAKELIKVNEDWDIARCIREIRKQASEVNEFYYVYVVDEDDMLKGTVSLKKLLIARSLTKIRNIVQTDIISVKTDTRRKMWQSL
jgi:magnesium transporter